MNDQLTHDPHRLGWTLVGIIFLWFALVQVASCQKGVESLPHIVVARSFVGVTEKGGNNRGPEVKLFLASVHLNQGYAWCAAFVSYCFIQTDVSYPTMRSAGARKFVSSRSVRAVDVLRGKVKVEPGWLLIWQNGNSWSGHIGFVLFWGTRSGRTIEGNTSSGSGSQRDGDGVYERTRSIQPGDYFRITHFEPVEYPPPPPPPRKLTIEDFQGGSTGKSAESTVGAQ